MIDLRRIFDNVQEIWFLTDSEGTLLLSSKHAEKFARLMQWPLVSGEKIFDLIPASWQSMARNMLTSLPESPLPVIFEVSDTTADGREIHLEFDCVNIKSEKGDSTHIFIQSRDLSSAKTFERKITVLARDYQALLETANAVIIGLDVRGCIIEWNRMAAQITGYSKSESYIQRFSDWLRLDLKNTFSGEMEKVLNGEMISHYEITVIAKEKSERTLLINATPRVNAMGQVVGISLIGQDITELSAYRHALEEKVTQRTKALKSALEKERQLVEVKDRFVSMASHEFRSPIAYIQRNLANVQANLEVSPKKDVVKRLSKIAAYTKHLSALLEDVLTIDKSGASTIKLKANPRSVPLRDFFVGIIDEIVSNTLGTHQIKLDFALPMLSIESDENLLRNIFVNLLTNAIKFSPGKREILLSVQAHDEHIECKIRDYGLGIEEKDLSKVFEPFYRGENVQTIKGTGLGLSIVKKAVDALNGEVKVESTPGQGTTFTVRLSLR